MGFLARRLGFYLLAAWASITLNFFLPRMMPGDPASAIFARFQGQARPEQIDAMRKAYGLSEAPLISQYWTYLTHVLRGDFGLSISSFPAPVTEVIGKGVIWTMLLGGVSTIIAFVVGCLLGVIGAWRRSGVIDSVMPPLLIFVGSFPYFWLATVALYFIGFKWDILPLNHAYSDDLSQDWTSLRFLGSVAVHLILPASTVVLVSVGGWLLGMRNTMISVIAEDYITMAQAKGIGQRRIMFAYAARNAILPNVTAFGMALGFVISGALVTEIVFAYPGLGNSLLTAVRNLDYPLMQGIFLMITFAVLAANLIVDLLYVRLDPRVRGS
jgi:peptide/nickel transport system permease protein